MNWRYVFLLVAVFPFLTYAKPIPKEQITDFGVKAFQEKAIKYSPNSAGYALKECDFLSEDGEIYAAILNFERGFLIIAADDAVRPVLAFDFENRFDIRSVAPAAKELVEMYKHEILIARRDNVQSAGRAAEEWAALRGNGSRNTQETIMVGPLLTSGWNQNKYYNYYSPIDVNSPSGYDNRTPNGCVAVAMAQIMYYYRYPRQGVGSHTNYSNYGSHYANFGQTTYNYDAMSDKISSLNNEVARLIYHCATSVDMNYASNGSGAYSDDVPSAMSHHFKYSYSAQNRSKYEFSNEEWCQKLKTELDLLRPVYYSGYSSEGGHAFVCDGYNDEDYFHFNFGWGNHGDGFFLTSGAESEDQTVGGYGGYQSAIFYLYPHINEYPEYCNDRTITALYGTLEDGSGNLDYQNSQYCTYIITSPMQYAADIWLTSIDIEEDHDFLKFWNGHPSQGNLLLEVTGSLPSQTHHYFEADSLYITFETDDAGTAAGWRLRFTSQRDQSGCSYMNSFSHSGTITDNSGENNYRDNSDCNWNIRVNDAQYVKFTFHEFDLSPEDRLDFYDLNSYPVELLASYSGSEIPQPLILPNNKIRVNFVSDNYLNAQGFLLTWNTDQTESVDYLNYDCNWSVYPNPVSDILNVNFPHLDAGQSSDSNIKADIFDMVGKKVMSTDINMSSNVSIPVRGLSEGVYTLRITIDGKTGFRKFVLNH